MKDLIKVELYKIYKAKLNKILFVFAIFSGVLLVYFSHQIAVHEMNNTNSLVSFFSDMQVFSLLGSIVIGMFFCEDFDNKIIENAVSSGHKRGAIIISKMVSLFLLTAIFAIPYCVALFIANGFNLEMISYIGTPFLSLIQLVTANTPILKIFFALFCIVLIYTAQLSIGILILFLVRKPVLVMIITYSLLGLLGNLLSTTEWIKNLLEWTPYGIHFMTLFSNFDYMNLLKASFISFIFICIIASTTIFLFRKTDIK